VRRLLVCLVLLALTTTACGVHGLSFVQDKRVDITAPRERSKVTLPVTIHWTVKNFKGSFGVLVDQAPPRTGETLPWLFRGLDACNGQSGEQLCQTRAFLAGRNVFETTHTRFTVDHVDRFTGNDRRRQFHEVTVVLLDAQGRRAGEGAWSVQFEVETPGG
jgi:hypothetical protein